MSDTEASPEKKARTFSCNTFREDIKGGDALKSLKKFVSAAKNSDDVVFEYLEGGGSLFEILSLIDKTAQGDLTTALPVFEVVHLILLRFQSTESEYHQSCLEAAKIILSSHLLTVKAMLSMNITKQKKVALKLLTAIVTLNSSFAAEVLNMIVLSPTMITDFIRHSSDKESVRKCFILFVLSFLIDGNTINIKNILEKKDFLSSIIPGLKFDEAETVNLTLSVLENKILKNVKIPKTLKLKLFHTQNIKYLFDLYNWKGPQSTTELIPNKKNKVKEVIVNPKEKELVVESVHSFLLLLCCSKKQGVAFADKSMGTSEQLNNQLLLTVFESLQDPLKNKKIAEVLMKTIAECPDLMKPVLLKLEPSFQPRDSKNWFDAITFAEELIKTINVPMLLRSESEEVTFTLISKVAKVLCMPTVLLRVGKTGAQKSQLFEIRLFSLKLLTTMWGEIEKLMTAFPKYENDLKKSMIYLISRYLPDGEDLIKLWHNLCDNEFLSGSTKAATNRPLFLSVILSALQIIVDCQKDKVSSLSLTSDMLKHVELIKDTMKERELIGIQIKIVQFVEMDIMPLTPNTDLFEKTLLILLRSPDNDCLSRASKILTSLSIFKSNKSEVDVWLSCYADLPSKHRTPVLNFLVGTLRRFFNRESDMDCSLKHPSVNGFSDDKMEADDYVSATDRLTPFLFECIETLKIQTSDNKNSNTEIFQQFLESAIIHLQLSYTTSLFLYDHFKSYKKIFKKSVINYLKSWKNNTLQDSDAHIFSCCHERELILWLLNEQDNRKFEDVIKIGNQNILKTYSLFVIVFGYFTNKAVQGDLKLDEVRKYVESLSFFIKTESIEPDLSEWEVLSSNLKSRGVLLKKFLNCLFLNTQLLDIFNIFKKTEGVSHPTTVIVKVLTENETVTKLHAKKRLAESWKHRFLEQLKTKVKKKKSVDDVEHLTDVLNFFDYNYSDAADLINVLTETDINLFVHKKKLSMWMFILIKFIKLYCQQESLTEEIIKKLCLAMKHVLSKGCSDVQILDGCFVYLLRRHPRHLLVIENEFLDSIMQRSNVTPETEVLVKLLLNDLSKVKHFLNNAVEILEKSEVPDLIFSALSVILIGDNSFLETLKRKGACIVWKVSEIHQKNSKKCFQVLQNVYQKFEPLILKAMKEEEENVILKNVDVSRKLIKLFIDQKTVAKLKKKISLGKMQPHLVIEAVKKINEEEITESFLQGLLQIFCRTIKNPKEENEVLWPKYCSIVSEVIAFSKDSSWQTVLESAEWKEFPKLALGYCFGSSKNPIILKILQLLISTLYKQEDKSLNMFFQMLISHSQFLNIILSKSTLKNELVNLFYCLTEKNCFEKSPKHIPILLAAYNASLSPCDQTILKILKHYENSGVGMGDYEPFVWAETAVSHYSVGGNPGLSLWQRFSMANVLDLLDSQRIELSLKMFPTYRSLELNQTSVESDPSVYDPAFLLPLFANLLSPGSVVFCLPFIYKGALGYTVRALSSECSDVRIVASVVLNRFYNHLEISQNLKQKLVWMHFIDCFRYSIKDISTERVPNITTLFFARMTLELSRQPAEMFRPLQNFLLAKPFFGFDTVPEFLPFFHSSEVSHWKQRQWLLEVLRDGTKTTSDLNLIYHSMAIKVIFCFFHSQLCDNETRKLILQVMESLIKAEKSLLLISEYGLLNWISSLNSGSYQAVLEDLLKLLSTTTSAIVKDIKFHKSKHCNLSHLIQVLNLAMMLLPAFKSSKSVEGFQVFLRIVFDCFNLFVNEDRDTWFKLNINKLQEIVESGVAVLGSDHNCEKYTQVSFFFRDFEEGSKVGEDLQKLVFLFNFFGNRKVNKENKCS